MQINMKNAEGAGPVLRRLMDPTYGPGSSAIGSATRGLSSTLWNDCPCFDFGGGGNSVGKFWNANSASTAQWTLTQAASGSMTPSSVQMGAILFNAGSTVKGSGIISCQLNTEPVFAATAAVSSAREIWFEARIRFAGLGGSGRNMLIGLCDVDTSLVDSANALAASNMLAFHNLVADTATFAGEKAGTSASVASAHTYVASTWVKLGFHVTATSTGVPTCYYFVNGVQGTATITSANIPTVGLVPSVALINQSAGGSQAAMEMDWICYAGKLGSSDVIGVNA